MAAISEARLQEFVDYCSKTFKGNEREEDKIFIDKFFEAFGYSSAIDAGAQFEYKIPNAGRGGGAGRVDLYWPEKPKLRPSMIFELKSRGENLLDHYKQIETYWQRMKPRSNYVILSNFDEFWIYDFSTQDDPIDVIALKDMPSRASAFNFMVGIQKPIFKNNQAEVTVRTAKRMGTFYKQVYKRGEKENWQHFTVEQLQRFTLQCVMAMFAEDRDLLPKDIFIYLVDECSQGGSTYDLIGGLFREMNTPGMTRFGRYEGVHYFNGGLFAETTPIELTQKELEFLDACARDNWSAVRPSIFGNIFESAIVESQERKAHGMHYTHEADIKKIVIPTITRYWDGLIDDTNTLTGLQSLLERLGEYRVLDPACGSGNFLYVAYQEMKGIERRLTRKMVEFGGDPTTLSSGVVKPTQFYGIDINPFAVQLARVSMMIARKIAADKYELQETVLPLDQLDQNIVRDDALFSEWPKADAIIGNPPFLGGYRMRQELGDEYAEKVFGKFSEVKSQVDFCCYWFRLSHDHLNSNGRAGLVGTNTISQQNTRKASLDYVTDNGGIIHEAISSQAWSGDAVVHVSIANWSYKNPENFYLDNKVVSRITSSLKSDADVSSAKRITVNADFSFEGVKPTGKGFIVSEEQVEEWIQADSRNSEILKLYSTGSNLARLPHCLPDRWIIDFRDMSIEEVSSFTLPFEHVRTYVKPEREKNREAVMREKWWRFKRTNEAMRSALEKSKEFLTVPRVSKWTIFVPAPSSWLPGDSTNVISSGDFYILGILTSTIHRKWTLAQGSTLKGDTRYTPRTCFETFPFPQTSTPAIVQQIRDKSLELHEYRSGQMEQKQWGITKLYNVYFDEPASQLYKLHKELDGLVMEAYGFDEGDDLLERLLALNLELAEKEKQGERVTGPWDPSRELKPTANPNT